MDYKHNARHLEVDLQWFRQVVETRYKLHHKESCTFKNIKEVPAPALNGHPSIYRQFLQDFRFSPEERLVLILSLVPHIQPYILDDFLGQINPRFRSDIPGHGQSLVPTVETALFLLAGDDLEKRFLYEHLFEPDALLLKENILFLDYDIQNPSRLSARLAVTGEYLSLLTLGKVFRPQFGHAFPAKRITTAHEWQDLVLPGKTRSQLQEIKAWITHGDTILYDWGLIHKFSPGYKCLFYGPAGTGKSTAAALLGKAAGLDVYRIDLSMVVSKYIGETEKNLRKIFDTAGNKKWILFFDEAESLFSKRTEVQDAHDRFANQEISYLLQRIEDYPGVVILATNMKSNLDEAFTRRFQDMVPFPIPGPQERLKIWQKGFSKRSVLEKAANLEQIAEKYELSGGSIMNVIRYASLMALEAGGNVILARDILKGIRREYIKEGKSL